MAYERRDFAGAAALTTLDSGLGAGVTTTFEIDSATGWPDGSDGDFFAVIDPTVDVTNPNSLEEKIRCSSRTGTTVTIATSGRGADGTSDVTHAAGARVWHVFTSVDANEANYWVAELAAAAAAADDVIIADGNDSLSKITKGASSTVFGVSSGGVLGYATVATAQIANNAVTAAKVAADVATQAELDTIAAAAVNDGDAAGGDLVGTFPNPTIAAGAVGTDEIATDGVGTAEIAAGAVGLAELAAASKAQSVTFSKVGTLTTGTGVMVWRAPFAVTLQHVRLYATTAPTGTTSTPIAGQSLVVDVHKNGTTVFTTQVNRPTIADGANAETATTAPDVTAVAAGDRITADIDFKGSTIAGADLTITVFYVLA